MDVFISLKVVLNYHSLIFYAYLEWLLHTVTVFVFSYAEILLVPFVKVYTNGITDANYIVPIFTVLISLANASYCLRLLY